MTTELQERARRRLIELVPMRTTIYTQRIDQGRNGRNYFSVLVISEGKIENISGYCASLLNKKHSTDVWPNSMGVQLQSESQIIELLGQELFDAYHAADLAESLNHVKL